MDLEKYWRIFAGKRADRIQCRVYGEYVLLSENKTSTLYDGNGDVFLCGKIKDVVPLPNGFAAVLKTEKTVLKWTVYQPDGDVFAQFNKRVSFLQNGLAYYVNKENETIVFSLFNEVEKINLGYGIVDICGMGDCLIYGQHVRRSTFYCLCKIIDNKIVDKRPFCNICRPFFFENGNFAAFDSSNNWFDSKAVFRVYDKFGQQIFSVNVGSGIFDGQIGNNHFFFNNGKRYKGVYSAKDGKLVLAKNNVSHYFDNGAYYTLSEGLVFHKAGSKITAPIYQLKQLGKSGALFTYKNRIFVIDTELSAFMIREKATSIMDHIASVGNEDKEYSQYLTELLGLL